MGAIPVSSSHWRGRSRFSVIAVCVVAAANVAAGQEEEPRREIRLEPVVVTATRTGLTTEESPASATVLDREDVQTSANIAVDDILRTIPGFSLYRRSSSLITPPDRDTEAQGVTLRNIGPAGASRALVMVDGVPIIGAYDGQVFWGKISKENIDRIEVVRGGGASLWGNYAMAGVINILTPKPTDKGATINATYGSDGLTDDDFSVSARRDKLMVGLEGNFFNLDGFPIVSSDQPRGPIDIDATSHHSLFNGRVGYQISDAAEVWLHGQYFDETLDYGTALSTSDTKAGLEDLTATLRTDDGSQWQAVLFSNQQSFHIRFAQADDDTRTKEHVTRQQSVPYTDVGSSLVWSRRMLDPLVLSSGLDLHWIDGQSRDQVFDSTGTQTDRLRSDGKQFFAGIFLEGIYTPTPQWEFALSGREDLWTNYDGTVTDSAGTSSASFPGRSRGTFNPRLGVLYRTTEWLHLRAAAYRAFRAPTLAELYRHSAVEDQQFVPNPNLSPERLNGAEAGIDLPLLDNFDLRTTGFWAEIQDPILNVDIENDAQGNPQRQRVNERVARTFGAEVEALYEIIPELELSGSYLFNDSTLVSTRPQEGDLAGFQLAQIPPHTATMRAEYRNPRLVTVRLEGRFTDESFEDQEHGDHLPSVFLLNLTVARSVQPLWNAEVFFAGENLTDREYIVDHGGGVKQIGSPLLVHGGVRFRL